MLYLILMLALFWRPHRISPYQLMRNNDASLLEPIALDVLDQSLHGGLTHLIGADINGRDLGQTHFCKRGIVEAYDAAILRHTETIVP